MAGHWPSCFFCVFMDREGVEFPKLAKKSIFCHLDRTGLVNEGFIIWLSGKFFLRDKTGSLEIHLARSGSQ